MMNVIYLGSKVGWEAACEVAGDNFKVANCPESREDVSQALQDAHGLLDASMKVTIDDELIRKAPKLSIISCATTGSDHIQRGELARRGIPVRTLKEDRPLLSNITAAAEHSWALLMACARRIPSAATHVRDGNWNRTDFPGLMLKGRQIGIIGCGRIGSWVARYATAFDMAVVGYDPYVESFPQGIEAVSLESLFTHSDVVSIHVHLTEETRGMVNSFLLGMIKPGTILINTSRGDIVDESALIQALKSKRLAAAGLDVIQGEPETGASPLVAYARKNSNLIITPHCGGFSPDAVRIVCRRAMEKIVEALL